MNLANYLIKRELLRAQVCDSINLIDHRLLIRGSWYYGDFHLDFNKNFTHSDLDILAQGISPQNELIACIEQKLDPIIKMKISIHENDFLSNISLFDSKIKNIFEYLIAYRNFHRQKSYMGYFKAKTLMLLLKTQGSDQRFLQIKDSIKHPAMKNLYEMKIGVEREIDISQLKEIVLKIKDETLTLFYDNCIQTTPSSQYFEAIRSEFQSCITIDNWLKSHIQNKLLSK